VSEAGSAETREVVHLDPDLLYAVARSNLTDQLASLSALDNKLGIMLGGGTALLALACAVFAAAANRVSLGPVALLGLAAVPYVFLLWNSIQGLRARDWDYGPNLRLLIERYRDQPRDANQPADIRTLTDQPVDRAKLAAIWTLRNSYDQNDVKSRAKESALERCGITLAITAAMVLLALVMFAFSASTQSSLAPTR